MLQIMTSLNLLSRLDLDADAGLLASGVTGTWVSFDGAGGLVLPSAAGDYAVPVWTESNRDGTVGWTPDVTATGKLTVLYGKLRAVTDQYTGNPTVGAKLYVTTAGKLSTTAGNGNIVAICTKAPYSTTYLSKAYTAIEFVTI